MQEHTKNLNIPKETAKFASGKLSRFAWCTWTKWIEECKHNPNHIISVRPPTGEFDATYFRIIAGKRAKEKDCRVHVHFCYAEGLIRLQFCWSGERTHKGLHISGKQLKQADYDQMAMEAGKLTKPYEVYERLSNPNPLKRFP